MIKTFIKSFERHLHATGVHKNPRNSPRKLGVDAPTFAKIRRMVTTSGYLLYELAPLSSRKAMLTETALLTLMLEDAQATKKEAFERPLYRIIIDGDFSGTRNLVVRKVARLSTASGGRYMTLRLGSLVSQNKLNSPPRRSSSVKAGFLVDNLVMATTCTINMKRRTVNRVNVFSVNFCQSLVVDII